jgi:hypothetical protein
MNKQETNAEEISPIWNPDLATIFSLSLTPIFGAYLHMINWRALGEPQRAATSQKWLNASIAMVVLYTILPFALPDLKDAEVKMGLVAWVFLISWYFASARSQAKFVKERYGTNYTKRPWGKALGIALLAYLGSMVVIAVLVVMKA